MYITVLPTPLIDEDDIRSGNQGPIQIPVQIGPDFIEKAFPSARLNQSNNASMPP